MRGKIFAGLALAGLLLFPALLNERAEAAVSDEEWVAALCYHGRSGFMVAPPAGWVNLPDAAAAYGLCVMYAPKGYDLSDAPVIIYPRVVALPAGPDPVQILVDYTLERLSALPGGGRTTVEPGPPLYSESGLRFETRYFNDGPEPNNYEFAAYHVGEDALLLLVLSARTEPERRAGEAALREVARGIFYMQVRDETGRAE